MARKPVAKERTLFEQRAKAFRVEAGLTLEEVAKDLQASANTVDSWERKGKIPRGDTLVKLAHIYGRQPSDFFAPVALPEPGIVFVGASDLPDEIRAKAVRMVRDLNRELREHPDYPISARPPAR